MQDKHTRGLPHAGQATWMLLAGLGLGAATGVGAAAGGAPSAGTSTAAKGEITRQMARWSPIWHDTCNTVCRNVR